MEMTEQGKKSVMVRRDHANLNYCTDEHDIDLPGAPTHASPDVNEECFRETDSDMSARQKLATKLRIQNALVRECMAECLGIFVLMIFGNGAVAQTVLSRGADGDYLTIYWGYGIGVTMGVYVAGGVSGAHINPAVSLAMSVFGRLPWKKLPLYVLSQVLGAFLSGPVVYGIYYDAINEYDGGKRQVLGPNGTASIFATYPKDYLSLTNGVFDQIFATAVLLCAILAINDSRNNKPPSGMEPLLVGFLVFALGNSYGTNCGYAINPARDFGPRLFTYMAGWGSEVFTAGDYWFWVPIVAPLIGGVCGAFVYVFVIELHWPPQPSTASKVRRRGSVANEDNRDAKSLIEEAVPPEEHGAKSAL